eukprot:m.210658 g.210658  ORF g.210658 m.210658 type:complete len:117 (+) comp15557_c2_seq15:432-782(+)
MRLSGEGVEGKAVALREPVGVVLVLQRPLPSLSLALAASSCAHLNSQFIVLANAARVRATAKGRVRGEWAWCWTDCKLQRRFVSHATRVCGWGAVRLSCHRHSNSPSPFSLPQGLR